MMCRWSVAPAQTKLTEQFAAQLGLSPLLAQCLVNRGVIEAPQIANFLEPRLKHLADPFLLPNMEAAVQRLFQAHARSEQIVLFGDYDVDGVTATSLLLEVLTRLNWKTDYYLPRRLDEGYGLSEEAVANCLKKVSATLLLAIDCGSNAIAPIQWLKEHGVDTIVLDHHQITSLAVNAVAVVNPQLSGPNSAHGQELCSAGLAFKFAHALVKAGRQWGLAGAAEFDLRPLLDLVALGTIADLVPLTGENRILVSAGLQRLNPPHRPGLQALRAVAGINGRIGVQEVAFRLAPRLNAAGRLENAVHALQLLQATDSASAAGLAQELDAQNRERQQIESSIAEQALEAVRQRFNPERDFVIVEGHMLWHLGVVGIVASRVLREFNRPTIIIGGDGEHLRGSGRSIEGFDLAAALQSCNDLLTRHGGHAMAAGLSLRCENLEPFRERLNHIARERLDPALFKPLLLLDAQTDLASITLQSITQLQRLEPLGHGNPQVRFAALRLTHRRPPQRVGKKAQHLKIWVTDGSTAHEAVWWNCGDKGIPEGRFDLAFTPEVNFYNDQQSVQLKVLDWRPAA